MRIVSVNLNKRLTSASAKVKFLGWLAQMDCDLLLAQEPWPQAVTLPPSLPGFVPIGGNANVFAWGNDRRQIKPTLRQWAENWHDIELGHCTVRNIYLSAYSSHIRKSFFSELPRELTASAVPMILTGDFNTAPDPSDGVFGNQASKWTSSSERTAFHMLLKTCGMVDTTSARHTNRQDFTIERLQRGKALKFRCDLAIMSAQLVSAASVCYRHETRRGESSFTDHSAVVIDLSDKSSVLSETRVIDNSNRIAECIRSFKTAIKRKRPSTVAREVVREFGNRVGSSILDYGCGYGIDVSYYRDCGFYSTGYDPHEAFGYGQFPSGAFDIVTVVFVLNIISDPTERRATMLKVARFVKPGGLLVVAARSPWEIEKEATRRGWARFGDGYLSDKQRMTFQKGITIDEIFSFVEASDFEKASIKFRLGKDITWVVLRRIVANDHGSSKPVC